MIVTIDGPSGSGKSTAARLLAKRLGFLYLDTGAMYRAVALNALRENVSLDDPEVLTKLARRSRIRFRMDPGHKVKILLDGEDVTEAIRHPRVSEAASRVATVSGVRRALVAQQRAIGSGGRVVAEGRDTGTVVFPRADLKLYLTASPKERAKRRSRDLKTQGHRATLAEVLGDLKRRDRRDSRRQDSPLRAARGAIRIDNTKLQSSQVLDKLFDYVRQVRSQSKRHRLSRFSRRQR